jgi:hypothetical protein
LRRLLRSAERLSEAAIFFGLRCANTLLSRSSASLSLVTRADQRRPDFARLFRRCDFAAFFAIGASFGLSSAV